jgi:L-malate glycosyltransferase
MKFLFSSYMPSGGMGTLNRIRSTALTEHGHDSRMLYTCV